MILSWPEGGAVCSKLSISVLSSGLTFRDVNKEAVLVAAGSHLVTMRVTSPKTEPVQGREQCQGSWGEWSQSPGEARLSSIMSHPVPFVVGQLACLSIGWLVVGLLADAGG